jgi:hypothetical protein
MSLFALAEAYEHMLQSERATFEEVVLRLLSDGLLWRDDAQDRRLYEFLAQHQEIITTYLSVAGWELRHYEQQKVFHVAHRDGRNRYRFTFDQTRLLLLLRLLYAQQREQRSVDTRRPLARHPLVPASDVFQTYSDVYGMRPKQTAFRESIQFFSRLKLLRILWSDERRDLSTAELELLPPLEIILMNEGLNALEERMKAYRKKAGEDDAEE